MDIVLDDHLLLEVLLGAEPPELRPGRAKLLTTGLWYHRLCRALARSDVVGPLTRRLGHVSAEVGAAVMSAVIRLPDSIELVSLRELGWPMARLLHGGLRLNLLGLEALAVAETYRAELCLATADGNPLLLRAASERRVPYRVISH